jgi:peptide/nickel transport system substrate-binding protein
MARSVLRARMLALFAIVCVLLAACGGGAPAAQPTSAPSAGEQPTSAPAAGEPTAAPAGGEQATAAPAGGETTASPQETLVFAGDLSDLLTFDPAVVYEFSGLDVVGNLYETLVSFDPGAPNLKPVLAKQWDVKDGGDMWTITFNLDERAKFSSGRPVTADDVVYSWGRVIDLNKSPAFLFIDIAQLKKENMRAVDPQTVEVKLPKTASPQVFLSILSFATGAVVDKQEVEKNAGSDMGSTWLNDHSAGSGPYVLESWERGAQVALTANPNYWGSAPKLKRIIFRNVTEGANLLSAIQTGEADIVKDLGPEQAAALEGNADVQLVKADSTLLIYLGMNAKVPPLDKPEVREAIRYVINYDEIVNTLLAGNAKPTQEIIPAGFLGNSGNNPFKQDIAKAKELIAQAGVAEGTELEMLVTAGANAPGGVEWGTLAAKIQSDLQQIGLTINIKAIQQSELLNIYREQKGQIVLILWGPDYPDPDGNVTPFTTYEAKSIAYRNGWEAPEIATLAAQAAQEQDSAKREELYKQISERVLHEGPYAILYQPVRTYGVRSNIKGFQYNAADTPNISLWLLSKS